MPVYTYTTFDDPLATTNGTIANGINGLGQIVGTYFNASGEHGFLLSGGT
jgi:probable HAF family extracellular repeat protein